jgi:hypothetical protein
LTQRYVIWSVHRRSVGRCRSTSVCLPLGRL